VILLAYVKQVRRIAVSCAIAACSNLKDDKSALERIEESAAD
jgi:hypothetical protein